MQKTNRANLQKEFILDLPFFQPKPQRTVEWFGGINYENLQKTLSKIKEFITADKDDEIHLIVNSFGGATGIGMNFYDMMKSMLKPNLTTIGSGDVDSSGIIVFLSGGKRYLTKNTTLLLHLAGRTLECNKRFSTADMETMLKEDRLKDYHYACVVAEATKDELSPEEVLDLMAKNTVLTATQALELGLAHAILE